MHIHIYIYIHIYLSLLSAPILLSAAAVVVLVAVLGMMRSSRRLPPRFQWLRRAPAKAAAGADSRGRRGCCRHLSASILPFHRALWSTCGVCVFEVYSPTNFISGWIPG